MDLRPELEMKVKRDERSRLIDDALVNKLKVKYHVITNQKALDYFTSILNDDYYKRTWKLPVNFNGKSDFIKIGIQSYTFQNFGDYLLKNQRSVQSKAPFNQIVSNQYEAFLSANLMQYQEAHLEEENKDYAHIVQEYRDGLLLFDLMETTIWNAARTDSIAVQDFYNAHKENYMWPDRVQAVVAASSNENILKKVGKLLEKDTDPEEIKSLYNKNNEVNIIFTTGLMAAQDQALPENFEFKKGLSKIYTHSDGFVIVMVKDLYPSTQKTLDEAKGNVVGDFQTFKENTWIEELKNKYKINVNEVALKQVKSSIKNQ